VAGRARHVAPGSVAVCCVDMLRSFGRGLRYESVSFILNKDDVGHYENCESSCLDFQILVGVQKTIPFYGKY